MLFSFMSQVMISTKWHSGHRVTRAATVLFLEFSNSHTLCQTVFHCVYLHGPSIKDLQGKCHVILWTDERVVSRNVHGILSYIAMDIFQLFFHPYFVKLHPGQGDHMLQAFFMDTFFMGFSWNIHRIPWKFYSWGITPPPPFTLSQRTKNCYLRIVKVSLQYVSFLGSILL